MERFRVVHQWWDGQSSKAGIAVQNQLQYQLDHGFRLVSHSVQRLNNSYASKFLISMIFEPITVKMGAQCKSVDLDFPPITDFVAAARKYPGLIDELLMFVDDWRSPQMAKAVDQLRGLLEFVALAQSKPDLARQILRGMNGTPQAAKEAGHDA